MLLCSSCGVRFGLVEKHRMRNSNHHSVTVTRCGVCQPYTHQWRQFPVFVSWIIAVTQSLFFFCFVFFLSSFGSHLLFGIEFIVQPLEAVLFQFQIAELSNNPPPPPPPPPFFFLFFFLYLGNLEKICLMFVYVLCLWSDWFCEVTWQRVYVYIYIYIWEVFWIVHLLMTWVWWSWGDPVWLTGS